MGMKSLYKYKIHFTCKSELILKMRKTGNYPQILDTSLIMFKKSIIGSHHLEFHPMRYQHFIITDDPFILQFNLSIF